MNIEMLIKENAKLLGGSSKVYVSPDIPEKKLNNGIAGIAHGTDPNVVLVIVDTTLFGSSKEGLLIIGDRLFINNFGKKEFLFQKIQSVKKVTIESDTESGKVEEKIYLTYNGTEEDITSNLACINKDGFVKFINMIIDNVKECESNLETTNQTCPLAMMSDKIKETYLKIVCNYAYSDDDMIDSSEYAEIMSLIAMNSIEKNVRLAIRTYMYDNQKMIGNEQLISFLLENVDAGSLEALKLSLVKDTVNMHWRKMKIKNAMEEWKECTYIVELAKALEVTDEQVNCIVENIKANKEIIENRQDDIQIKKNMQELAAKAGAVGVPLAAIYLSGSVIGVSAAGMTSGLAALGMGGVLGFSSMFTGIGIAVLLGVGAYKGVKKVTGMGDLEKNKQREMMLLGIAKNSQKALNYLVEDVNEITSKLQEEILKGQETEIKIQKLAGILAMMTKGARQTAEQIDYAEKEKMICQLPKRIKTNIIEELTNGATRQPIRKLILDAYCCEQVDEDGNKIKNCLNMEQSLEELESVYNALESIGFYNMAENSKAHAVNAAKGLMKGLLN